MQETLVQAHGGVVTGDRFWDREAELDRLAQMLDEGASVLLIAQRRMGKTSLMRETANRISDRFTCVLADLQKSFSPADAVTELSLAMKPHASLWTRATDVFASIFSAARETIEELQLSEIGFKIRSNLSEGNWTDKADQLLSAMASSDRRVVLFLDEVPIMVNRILKGDDYKITAERRAATDGFMSWLRKARQQHQGRVSIVISGSIGLEPVLHQANLSATLTGFTPLELRPWDAETAQGCIDALAKNYDVQLEEGVAEAIISHLNCCIPHHIQMFFDAILTRCATRHPRKLHLNEVDGVYCTDMLSIRGHVELTHYEERLKLVLGPELFPPAIEMLTEAAVERELTPRAMDVLKRIYTRDLRIFDEAQFDKAQEEILLVLQHDGYLTRSNGGYSFISYLVRDWWKRRYDTFFTPLRRRGA
jgi:hypothetical protein